MLDHDTYDWQPARPALELLRQHEIPLVLVSSKTLAELEDYREQLQLDHPVVAENGAATYIPRGYFPGDATLSASPAPRAELRDVYEKVQSENAFNCAAFYELGISGIVRETGLTEQQASRADDRKASEPILWLDSDERAEAFARVMKALGYRCVMGGRFLHLMGNTGKEDAVRQLLQAYARKWPGRNLKSVSLGDGPNDLGMLSSTDIAVIIRGKHKHRMALSSHQRALRPGPPGPAGWNEAVLSILAELQESRLNPTGQGA